MDTRKNLNKLINEIRAIDNSPSSEMGFDMSEWFHGAGWSDHPCGTACCIQGHAQILFGNPRDLPGSSWSTWFGMDTVEWTRITVPPTEILDRPYMDIKPHHAVALLKNFRDTGEVNWPLALTEKETA